jgi:N-methylhydantoinase B
LNWEKPDMPAPQNVDFIAAELLRFRLEAICGDGGRAIERTAISPIVTDSKDYSCTLLDAQGDLVVGGGKIRLHFYGASSSVKAVMKVHGSTLAPGDLFLANDPHHGGALHPQDVFVILPVFVGGTLVSWFAASAHMLDMGGMAQGSYAPDATECYQEAVRFPPVRLSKAGVEQSDVWAILKNNIRIPAVVEMDMRSLAAGCNVAAEELVKIVADMGAEAYGKALDELADRVRQELRRRINELEPGVYRAESWVEWRDEIYHVPCALTVATDKLTFDFSGASPQSTHFMNSKDFIVTSEIGADLSSHFANDLPLNRGVFECFQAICPAGTIVNSQPPAPVGNAHMDVGMTTAECAIRALMMAIEASPRSSARPYLMPPAPASGYTAQIWAGKGEEGEPLYWTMTEAMAVGGAGSIARDGTDLGVYQIGQSALLEYPDVEVWESWYPWRILGKRLLYGPAGSGVHRSGGRLEIVYEPYGVAVLTGSAIGNRQRVPLVGFAGGYPGGLTATYIERADGTREHVYPQAAGLVLKQGDRFICLNAGGGGWGDPLDRPIAPVEDDVQQERMTAEDALRDYCVVIGDEAATRAHRRQALRERLARAIAPAKPLAWSNVPSGWHEQDAGAPLASGIEQRGGVAVSIRSGAPLALAPDHWTDGCPVIRNFLPMSEPVEAIAYLDPITGHTLFVDIVADGALRSFNTQPLRWSEWTPPLG